MQNYNKRKASMALELLEQELEILTKEEQRQINGQMGVITGGTGTPGDPYIVSATYYHYDLTAGQRNGLQGAISEYNSSSATMDSSGDYYKFNLSEVQVASEFHMDSAMAASQRTKDGGVQSWANRVGNSMYGGSSSTSTGINYEFGSNAGNSIELYNGNVQSVMNSASSASFHVNTLYTNIFAHEIGHNLGLPHNSTSALMSSANTFQTVGGVLNAVFGTVSQNDLSNILNNHTFSGYTSEFGTGVRR